MYVMKPLYNKFRVFGLLLLLVIGITAVSCRHRGSAAGKKIERIVIISIDTCRADYLSCYGYRRKTTPNIDAIARDGILFEHAVSPVPLTLPAHSTMLTGTIPPYHKVRDNNEYRLGDSNVTLAEMLKEKGFATGAVIGAFVLDSMFGLEQGFDSYNDEFEDGEKRTFAAYNERGADEVSYFANQWLGEHYKEPFFLFVHYYDPHDPYDPPYPFSQLYADDLYAGEVAFVDDCIGRVIGKLKELGVYESTLIIIAGDHGESLGEHSERTHGFFVYDSGIDVPLILKVPGGAKGKRVGSVVGLVDIVPTVLSVVGIEAGGQIHGIDLGGYIGAEDAEMEERYIYSESFLPTKYNANPLLAVVTDRFKYIQATREELYDLVEDSKELNNLAVEQGARVRILGDKLNQILEEQSRKEATDSKLELDDAAMAALESLGYIGYSRVSEDVKFDENKKDPKDLIDFHILAIKANHLVQQGKYDEAKKLCEKMLSQQVDLIDGYLLLAKMAMEQKDYKQGVIHLKRSFEIDPEKFDVNNMLGLALSQLGQIEEAIKHYTIAVSLMPEETKPLNNLGSLLAQKGQVDKAIEYFKKAVELDQSYVDAHLNLAIAYTQKGEIEQAIVQYQKLLELGANPIYAHYQLAMLLYRQQKTEDAIGHLNESLRMNANQPEVLNILAWIRATCKDERFRKAEEAVSLAKSACELTRFGHVPFLDTLAVAYAGTGDFAKAVETSEKAMGIAEATGQKQFFDMLKKRIEFYKAGKPGI